MINHDTGDVPHVSEQNHVRDGVPDGSPRLYPLAYEIVHMDSGKADVEHAPTGEMNRPYHSADFLGSPMGREDGIAETGMLERVDRGARKRRER